MGPWTKAGQRWWTSGAGCVVAGCSQGPWRASCSGPPASPGATSSTLPPGPEGAAKALAAGLAGGSLGSIPFDGATGADATAFVTTAVGDLKDIKRTVTVTAVTTSDTNDKAATATLTWAWDLGSAVAGSTSTGPATGTATSTPSPTSSAAASTQSPAPGATGAAPGAPANPDVWTYTVQAALTLHDDKTWHPTWSTALLAPDLTSTERLSLSTTNGTRADIVGANNQPLMTERAVADIGIDKTRVPAAKVAASAAALAKLVGIDAAAFTKRVQAAGPKAFVIGITVRESDPLAGKAAQIAAIPGAVSIPEKRVLAPTSTFAPELLGVVGQPTAEMIKNSKGTLKATDVVGLSGLEARYDARLRGGPGLTVDAVGTDAGGKKTSRQLFDRPATTGTPLRLTLDIQAQLAAESALAGQTSTPTSLVAIRPSTGEIVAAANGPANHGATTATTGHAAPGSTFKIVTALALLRAGLTPDSQVQCTPTFTVNGRIFKNYSDYPPDKMGTITLRTAFANSCNTAFISNQAKVSQADLASAAASLGIGVDLDLGFPAFLGSVPAQGTGTTHAASMIGQANVLVDPMDMATVVASVVKGSVVRPELVLDNPAVPSFPKPPKPLTSAEAAALRQLMGAVVTEGTGAVLRSSGVTLAKTGTAEYGTATPLKTHAWMVAAKGDLAIVAYVEDGQSGSGTAAPLIKDFLAHYSG